MKSKITCRVATAVFLSAMLLAAGKPVCAFTPGACRQDAARLCPGIPEKDAVPCLKQHQADLSMDCKVNLAEARERVRQTREACEEDTRKFCANVEPGKGRILHCLKSHDSEISSACRNKIAETKKKILPDAPGEK